MSKKLNDLAAKIADEQSQLEGSGETTRQRVLRMGKELRDAQVEQKKEQDETGQTWKEWCEEQKRTQSSFPDERSVRMYSLISRFPAAYKPEMSIKEAYKEAGRWKKNNGKEPPKAKVEMQRELVRLQSAIGRADRKIEALTDVKDIVEYAASESWDEDEVQGALEGLALLRSSTTLLIKMMKEIEFHEVH